VDRHEAERAAPARVIGIGASAGGVEALTRIVRRLPADLEAAVCVVLHIPATGRSLLAPILDRETRLSARVAVDAEPLRAGRLYVAPADRHLIAEDGRLRLERGPKENGVRPAVDPMLRSLAAAYGERAVAVVLSGALGDGSSGALAVRRAGGTVIVQDPADATVPSMPESALEVIGTADLVLPAVEIGPALAALDLHAEAVE
jgi:two-component system, chemotaxis family, protein-glutamate methylesterase/glutaminase